MGSWCNSRRQVSYWSLWQCFGRIFKVEDVTAIKRQSENFTEGKIWQGIRYHLFNKCHILPSIRMMLEQQSKCFHRQARFSQNTIKPPAPPPTTWEPVGHVRDGQTRGDISQAIIAWCGPWATLWGPFLYKGLIKEHCFHLSVLKEASGHIWGLPLELDRVKTGWTLAN